MIRPLTEEYFDVVADSYQDKEYISQRIQSGGMFGAFVEEKLAGFMGVHDDGCLGMLSVLEEYRGSKVGKALAVYLINKTLELGWIPYMQFRYEDEISMQIQEELGLYMAKTPVVWMWKE